MDNNFYVYIITDKIFGTLYIGMTNDLPRRMFEHKNGLIEGFTKKYGLKILVYYEVYPTHDEAFTRERQMKKWNRDWKIELIHQMNRDWKDLTDELN